MTLRSRPFVHVGLALSALMLGACEPAPATTSLRITAYGEAYIEDRIPAADFVDGWEVQFDRFLLAIGEVSTEADVLDGGFVLDLTSASDGRGHSLGELDTWMDGPPLLDYQVSPLAAATPVSATEDDVAEMVDRGLSILAQGHATRGEEIIEFSWGLSTTTRYTRCRSTADLAADSAPHSQLTIHADHLFYDDLDSPNPNVAFDLVASADRDADGRVTEQELAAVDITGQAHYQVGSAEITDLWAFVEAQAHTLGHVDGEGHCDIER